MGREAPLRLWEWEHSGPGDREASRSFCVHFRVHWGRRMQDYGFTVLRRQCSLVRLAPRTAVLMQQNFTFVC